MSGLLTEMMEIYGPVFCALRCHTPSTPYKSHPLCRQTDRQELLQQQIISIVLVSGCSQFKVPTPSTCAPPEGQFIGIVFSVFHILLSLCARRLLPGSVTFLIFLGKHRELNFNNLMRLVSTPCWN